jgi:hypothetical protein
MGLFSRRKNPSMPSLIDPHVAEHTELEEEEQAAIDPETASHLGLPEDVSLPKGGEKGWRARYSRGKYSGMVSGFKLGQKEHIWRWRGYCLFWLGIVTLGIGAFVWAKWLVYAAGVVLLLSLVCETISYIFHRLEKRAFDGMRRGRK